MATAAAPTGDRRDAIIQATVALIMREGLGAVSHRTIAREAGVPLGATTYYFASKTELLRDALDVLVDDEIALLQEAADRVQGTPVDIDVIADTLVKVCGSQLGLGPKLARFEVFIEAARRPALRPIIARRTDALCRLAIIGLQELGAPDPEDRAAALVAAIDGTLLQELADEHDEARLRKRMRAVVRAIAS